MAQQAHRAIPFNAPTGGWRVNQLSEVVSLDNHNILGDLLIVGGGGGGGGGGGDEFASNPPTPQNDHYDPKLPVPCS